MINIELHYLNTLKVIIESDSFAEAAEKLNYTRSTVTFHVQQLEKEFGIILFEKIGKRMYLTKEGRTIMPYVENILSSYDQIMICGSRGVSSLRIAVPESLLTYRFQPIIQAFREIMPLVDLKIQTRSCYEMNKVLLSDNADIAIHYDVNKTDRNILSKKLTDYPLIFFGSPLLSTEERDFLTPDQRKEFGFIDIETDGLYRHSIDKILTDKNITLSNDLVLGSIAAIIQCTKMGLGISVLPLFAVENELKRGELIRFDAELVPDSVSVVYSYHTHKRLSHAIRLFLELAEEMI